GYYMCYIFSLIKFYFNALFFIQMHFNTAIGTAISLTMVAIAAAQETLNVIREENLQANAKKIGEQIKVGFSQLMKKYDVIGDVRGAGLYIGVEIISDRKLKSPDAVSASRIVNELRERRVLISATGFHSNTLKIRPPLIFSDSDASRLLSESEAVFAGL
ncbi:MAG: aminotransferase class III-fold pyridoxal phosphate-dependent enzyme, partial [Afipia sp.]|nr:aminotransferase class III-fold pyridoxal phosphate-dependent enzyme [Afipia sp.]